MSASVDCIYLNDGSSQTSFPPKTHLVNDVHAGNAHLPLLRSKIQTPQNPLLS